MSDPREDFRCHVPVPWSPMDWLDTCRMPISVDHDWPIGEDEPEEESDDD